MPYIAGAKPFCATSMLLQANAPPCFSLAMLCPCVSVLSFAYALHSYTCAMPMPCLAHLCLRSTAQIYAPAHLCHAFASHIAATHSHCLAMQSSAPAPQFYAKALPHPCISKRLTSSQCLRKSMPRLTKQCPHLAWPSYAAAHQYPAMQCRSAAAPCEAMP